jgi:hypothetical protein
MARSLLTCYLNQKWACFKGSIVTSVTFGDFYNDRADIRPDGYSKLVRTAGLEPAPSIEEQILS